MNFGPVQHILATFMALGAPAAKPEVAIATPSEPVKPEGGELADKFFVYVGCLESEQPLKEIVIETVPKPVLRETLTTSPPRPVANTDTMVAFTTPAIA